MGVSDFYIPCRRRGKEGFRERWYRLCCDCDLESRDEDRESSGTPLLSPSPAKASAIDIPGPLKEGSRPEVCE